MMEKRLFSHEPLAENTTLHMTGNDLHYLTRVLRMRPGDRLALFDGRGGEYPAKLVAIDRRQAEVQTEQKLELERESDRNITLVQATIRGERMDWIVQKATELGVSRIQAVVCQRSQNPKNARNEETRQERWLNIAISACQQSGRNRIPTISKICSWQDFLADSKDSETKWILDPQEKNPPISETRSDCQLAIGPEGGFSDEELALARQNGWTGIGLGARVLRAETAALAALSLVQYAGRR